MKTGYVVRRNDHVSAFAGVASISGDLLYLQDVGDRVHIAKQTFWRAAKNSSRMGDVGKFLCA